MGDPGHCIFCGIVSKKIPKLMILETDQLVAFHDISPVAPVHVLIVPKIHVASVNELSKDNAGLVADMMVLAKQVAHDQGIGKSGYRLVINTERDGGQTVDHLHLHLMGGRAMSWPPG
jgi:histidine triad (HIT) family protein